MIPNAKTWKSWSHLDRISYCAQFAASLALLPTVVFAYLAWREARLAREDQTEFFLAEKAPRVEVKEIHIDSGILTVDLHNSGESVARDIRVDNIAAPVSDKFLKIYKFNQMNLHYEKLDASQRSAFKGESIVIQLASNFDVERAIGFIPWGLKKSEMADGDILVDGTTFFQVIVMYRDIRNKEYMTIAHSIMKPNNYKELVNKHLQDRDKPLSFSVKPKELK